MIKKVDINRLLYSVIRRMQGTLLKTTQDKTWTKDTETHKQTVHPNHGKIL